MEVILCLEQAKYVRNNARKVQEIIFCSANIQICNMVFDKCDVFVLFNNLTSLNFNNCEQLTNIPHAIGLLPELESLMIMDCKRLTSLPKSMNTLAKLKTLLLYRCPALRLKKGLMLSGLTKCTIDTCYQANEKLDQILQFPSLNEFILSTNDEISVPDTIIYSKVRILNLLGCTQLRGLSTFMVLIKSPLLIFMPPSVQFTIPCSFARNKNINIHDKYNLKHSFDEQFTWTPKLHKHAENLVHQQIFTSLLCAQRLLRSGVYQSIPAEMWFDIFACFYPIDICVF